MVSEEKVRMMTQIALDEKGVYKKEIREGAYYKGDYIRSHVLSALWNITISYVLLLFLLGLYHADYIFLNVVRFQYKRLAVIILGIYSILLLLGGFLSYYYFADKYKKNRHGIHGYLRKLENLEQFYKQSKEEAENDTDITD